MIDYVRTYADRFGVEPILAVLNEHGIGVAPSTYYAHAAAGFGLPKPSYGRRTRRTGCEICGRPTGACMGAGNCGSPPAGRGWASAGIRWNG